MKPSTKKAQRELRAKAADGFTPQKRSAFLSVYAKTGNMTEAAKKAKISRPVVYEWLRADAEFRKLFRDAREQAADALEAEARRRAVEGWDEPVFHKGYVCGEVRKYSDSLLQLLLKAAKPRRYRERQELSGDPNRPIKTESQVQIYIPNNGRGAVSAKEDK
jgi:hypothetical protein